MTDRRTFDGSGEPKENPPSDAGKTTAAEPPKTEPGKPVAPPARAEPARSLPPADFATLVLSLGSSAVMYLGQDDGGDGGGDGAEDAGGKKPERNLPMAKHAIDLLTVLEDKTKGNLSAEEEHILESLLFDLRLRYVEALKTPPSAGAAG